MIKKVKLILLLGVFFGCLVAFHLIVAHNGLSLDTPTYYKNRVVVLLYHDFKSQENGTAISANRLNNHFNLLAARGFHIISLDQVAGFMAGKNTVPPNALAITMDDGYASNYFIAYPLLLKRNWPATVFLTVSNVGRVDGKRSRCRWLTWQQINEMQQNGISFGGHTYNAHFFTPDSRNRQMPWLLAKLPAENDVAYQRRISGDFRLAQVILEKKLQQKTTHFAAPFGMYDNSVVKAGHSSGYQYFWSTEPKPITRATSSTRMGRVSVGIGGTSGEELIDKILTTATSVK